MRTFDFAPLHRATVGFDQIADMMDRVLTNDAPQNSYPPYNIEKTDDDAYRISIVVAGFSEPDLNVEVRENSLIVTAKKADKNEDKNTSIVVLPHGRLNGGSIWPTMFGSRGPATPMECCILT